MTMKDFTFQKARHALQSHVGNDPSSCCYLYNSRLDRPKTLVHRIIYVTDKHIFVRRIHNHFRQAPAARSNGGSRPVREKAAPLLGAGLLLHGSVHGIRARGQDHRRQHQAGLCPPAERVPLPALRALSGRQRPVLCRAFSSTSTPQISSTIAVLLPPSVLCSQTLAVVYNVRQLNGPNPKASP